MKYILLTICSVMVVFLNQQMLGANLITAIEDKISNQKRAETVLFTGVYAAALTPMHNDFRCNCEELATHCSDLMNRGCTGVVLFGTTGEGSSFSVSEREMAIKNLIQLGLDPQKVIVGILSCAIDDVIKLASVAIDQQCAAVLVAPPFFYKKVDDAGVVAFYKKIIQEINHPDLKIILYHIPQYSDVPITLNIIKELREEFPNNVIGIKESEGNLSLTKEVLSTFPGFKVFVGNELQISEAVQLGASGGISGIVNAYPELICSLYEFGKNQQKPNYNKIAQNIVQSLKNYPIFPAIKNIVEKQKGQAWHVLRPPLMHLDELQSQALNEALTNSL
jgi:4-hydroxy-tetrahydrodipicolinate synthase